MEKPVNNFGMTTLVSSINSFVLKGYDDDYKAQPSGLKSLKSGKIYKPEEVKVIDFHRFEGASNPEDESILYAIETNDGGKGLLVDAYGPASDTNVSTFMQFVEDFAKNAIKKG